MEKGCPSNIGHRTPHLLPGVDDIDPKGIDGVAANVIAVNARDEDLTLMIIYKKATNHLGLETGAS